MLVRNTWGETFILLLSFMDVRLLYWLPLFYIAWYGLLWVIMVWYRFVCCGLVQYDLYLILQCSLRYVLFRYYLLSFGMY